MEAKAVEAKAAKVIRGAKVETERVATMEKKSRIIRREIKGTLEEGRVGGDSATRATTRMREAEAEAEAVQRAKKYITHFAWHFEDERRPWGSRSSAIDKNKKSYYIL